MRPELGRQAEQEEEGRKQYGRTDTSFSDSVGSTKWAPLSLFLSRNISKADKKVHRALAKKVQIVMKSSVIKLSCWKRLFTLSARSWCKYASMHLAT